MELSPKKIVLSPKDVRRIYLKMSEEDRILIDRIANNFINSVKARPGSVDFSKGMALELIAKIGMFLNG